MRGDYRIERSFRYSSLRLTRPSFQVTQGTQESRPLDQKGWRPSRQVQSIGLFIPRPKDALSNIAQGNADSTKRQGIAGSCQFAGRTKDRVIT
jgi:hypothetical protein